MKRIIRYSLVVLISLLQALGLAAQTAEQEREDKAKELYYRALIELQLDRPTEAFHLLQYSHWLQPNDPAIAYALGKWYIEHGQDEGAARQGGSLLRQAYASDTTNLDYLRAHVLILTHEGAQTEAIALLEDWLSRHPDSESEERMLGRLYHRAGEYGKAIDLYTRLQDANRDEYIDYARLSGIKAALHEASGSERQAEDEYRELVQRFPNEPDAKVRLIQYLFGKNQYAAAIPYIDSLERRQYDSTTVRGLRIQTARGLGDSIAELALLEALLSDPEASAEMQTLLWKEFLYSRMEEGKLPTQYNYAFERIIAQHGGEDEPVMAYAQILGLQGRHAEALELVRPLTRTHPESPEVWRSLIGSAISLEDNEQITALSLEAIQYIQTEWRYYFYAAIGLYSTDREDEAIALLEGALPKLEQLERNGYSTILGQLGDIYAEREQTARAYEYYERALEADPDNTSVLNNYAYSLAEANQDLDKAERMAARGVKLRGDDSNTLDTYAWIFYKRGKYSLARLYQSKAIEAAGDSASAVMYDHLGDIYLALDNNAEAISAWTHALSLYNEELKQERGDTARTRTRLRVVAEKLAKVAPLK